MRDRPGVRTYIDMSIAYKRNSCRNQTGMKAGIASVQYNGKVVSRHS